MSASGWAQEPVPDRSWPAEQIADFLSAVSAHSDPIEATRRGVQRVAEMLEADAVAVIREGCPTIGTGPGGEPLAAGIDGEPLAAEIAREPLDEEQLAWLVVARAGGELTGAERDLLRGMARVLGVTRELIVRRRLLERVAEIHRQIVRRAPADEVLQAIVEAAAELTASEVAVIRHIDPEDEARTHIGASVGHSEATLERLRTTPHPDGIGLVARRENRLVVSDSYQSADEANPVVRQSEVQAAMAAPVREGETVVGSLVVGCRGAGRRYRAAERDAMQTFAEYASMALTDARLVADAVHRAMHDALTELPNRALFTDRLEQALARCQRTGARLAVLFLDIDRFKTVNDSLGHIAGDELLRAAAKRLRACIRPGDTASRFGGDEFTVLVEDGDEAAGEAVAERILAAFAQPFAVAGRRVHLGASIGIATAGRPGDDPLRDGDLAMYRAKAEGRGRSAVFMPSMRTAARERLELETELRGAAERGELFLEYQPIVRMSDETVVAVEALVRWQHPTRGRLAPDQFLPVAEETGEIAAIGRWVLRTACAQANLWQPRAPSGARLTLSVNLSPTQLYATDIVADVRDALAETGLQPEALVLELTETVLMADFEASAARLRELTGLGVRIALDDFGTGHCSLQYLQRLPIEFLKIARPFVAEIAEPGADLALIRAIADLGVSCGLRVVAEGIEEPVQWSRLLEVGCELGQGYLFARPEPAERFEQRLR
jgi:diguanylate cyclase (GGDEF)-like protein